MYSSLSSLQEFVLHHTQLLCDSYSHWLRRELLPGAHPARLAELLFDAPFALVSHDAQPDPVFNYANRGALELFGYSWQEFTSLPSRHSAEPVNQPGRQEILQQVAEHGHTYGYSGVRIARDGSRFEIRSATLWNVLDRGDYCGQAAMITDWQLL